MKLYTEEQVIRMYIAGWSDSQYKMQLHLKLLTPIKLPSDEEIDSLDLGSQVHTYHTEGFTAGAKWVIEQIKR